MAIDKDAYEAAEKKDRKKVTAEKTKKIGINCGQCKWRGRIDEDGNKLEANADGEFEPGADMCFYPYPNVQGGIGLRGARANNAKNQFCGMHGRFFYPKDKKAAGVAEREADLEKVREEARAEMRKEMEAEQARIEAEREDKPGDEAVVPPVAKNSTKKKSKPGEG